MTGASTAIQRQSAARAVSVGTITPSLPSTARLSSSRRRRRWARQSRRSGSMQVKATGLWVTEAHAQAASASAGEKECATSKLPFARSRRVSGRCASGPAKPRRCSSASGRSLPPMLGTPTPDRPPIRVEGEVMSLAEWPAPRRAAARSWMCCSTQVPGIDPRLWWRRAICSGAAPGGLTAPGSGGARFRRRVRALRRTDGRPGRAARPPQRHARGVRDRGGARREARTERSARSGPGSETPL